MNNTMSKVNKVYNQKYIKIKKIGNGAFGCVYKVILDNDKNQQYAMKKYYLDNIKFRENFLDIQYKMLKELEHDNIIKPIDYFYFNDNHYIIYEYLEWDLSKLIMDKDFILDEEVIRKIVKNIVNGLNYLHKKGVIHRDLKPDNILVDLNYNIKINDFDLARYIDTEKPMSKGVATIYYRPPEIFFGETSYSFSVDLWSLGCILAEMILREPIFKGRNEIDVVCKIFDLLGPADENNWPGCSDLPNYMPFGESSKKNTLSNILKKDEISNNLVDIIEKLLVLDPKKRLSVNELLNHPFLQG